ncbi:enoyl-CoA hydratase/isomerase family protein [Arthrobacter sulfonylureivorans]|uniref:enoyl-CoA hydratase/isomerase family protein n=1 Tax=Arthrobacter sulfonylureivorans TaxID=2486855 RepID=UPI0039E4FB07
MPVNLQIANGVAVLTLNAPDALNVLDDDMTADVIDALEQVAAATDVAAMVMTGAGRAFSVGGRLQMLTSLSEEADRPGGREALTVRMRRNARLVELVRAMPQLSIAAVNGACVGAALGWIGACDLRVAANSAKFNTAFLSLGLSSDFGTTRMLAECVGRARAADWLLRPRVIGAQEAYAAGLVGEVVEAGILIETALEWARAAVAFPGGVTAMKENLRDGLDLPLADALDRESERFVQSLASPEAAAQIHKTISRS